MGDHYLLKKWSTRIPVILVATGVMLSPEEQARNMDSDDSLRIGVIIMISDFLHVSFSFARTLH